MAQQRCRNHILSKLSRADFALLEKRLKPVELELRLSLEERNRPIETVYFPENGLVSVVAVSGHEQVEAGIIGREGMTGIAVIMGDDRSINATFIQIAGSGLSMEAAYLREAIQKSESLHRFVLHFVQAFMAQMAHTALANGRAKVETRLARWLLMAHDRLDGDELPLTHEFLAMMLGVRRAGVTTALHVLEEHALVSVKRATIVVEDRAGLVKFADSIYGIPEGEYRRLIGWTPALK
jgi:CRP-like cAMP-binding protein